MTAREEHTRRKFSPAERTLLLVLQRDLGDQPTRQEVQNWFRKLNKKWADEWIVMNGFILKPHPDGKKHQVCILDPKRMPRVPFPPVRPKKNTTI